MLLLTSTPDKDVPRMYGNFGTSIEDSLFRMPRLSFEWLLDAKGDVRVATARGEGKNVIFLKEGREWREITAVDPQAGEAFKPELYVGWATASTPTPNARLTRLHGAAAGTTRHARLWQQPRSRRHLWKRIEAFLARHIGAATPGS